MFVGGGLLSCIFLPHPLQGSLRMWVDILSLEDASAYPMIDIAPTPLADYEVRAVVWKTRDIPLGDKVTTMSGARGRGRNLPQSSVSPSSPYSIRRHVHPGSAARGGRAGRAAGDRHALALRKRARVVQLPHEVRRGG